MSYLAQVIGLHQVILILGNHDKTLINIRIIVQLNVLLSPYSELAQ